MTPLDLGTVLLLHNSSLVAGAGALLLVWLRAERPPGVLSIASAFLLLGFGAFLAGLGEINAIPQRLWRSSSAGLGVTGYLLVFFGMRRLDRPVGRARWLALAVPAVVLAGVATPVFDDNATRAVVFHSAAALANLAAGLSLLSRRRAESLPSRAPLATILLVCAGLYGLHIPWILAGLARPGSFALVFALTIMMNFAIAALIVSFVRERREEVQRRASMTDALTGILNRHGFGALVPAQLAPPAAILLFDLDHFKRINDRFGHAGGDHALIGFARLVEDRMGPGDVLARLGGEEFVVYLGDGATGRAEWLAEEIRLATAEARIDWRDGAIAVSTSVGVALAGAHASNGREALLALADTALYRAKSNGRNRVEVAASAADGPRPPAAMEASAQRIVGSAF